MYMSNFKNKLKIDRPFTNKGLFLSICIFFHTTSASSVGVRRLSGIRCISLLYSDVTIVCNLRYIVSTVSKASTQVTHYNKNIFICLSVLLVAKTIFCINYR